MLVESCGLNEIKWDHWKSFLRPLFEIIRDIGLVFVLIRGNFCYFALLLFISFGLRTLKEFNKKILTF